MNALGDKKYVLPSLLPEFAGKVNLIYIDPPFDTGADFSFTATIPQTRGTRRFDQERRITDLLWLRYLSQELFQNVSVPSECAELARKYVA